MTLARHTRTSVPMLVAAMFGASAGALAIEAPGFDVVVPRVTIFQGDLISADMLVIKRIASTADLQAQPVTDASIITGRIAKRTLLPGQPITSGAVKIPDVVTQGRSYLMIFQSGDLTISSYGVPMQSGGTGDIINVRNPDTGVIVKGRVRADSTIAIEDR